MGVLKRVSFVMASGTRDVPVDANRLPATGAIAGWVSGPAPVRLVLRNPPAGAAARALTIDPRRREIVLSCAADVDRKQADALEREVRHMQARLDAIGAGWRVSLQIGATLARRSGTGPRAAVGGNTRPRELDIRVARLPLSWVNGDADVPLQAQAQLPPGQAATGASALDEYIGVLQPLKSPFILFARRADLERARDDDWVPFYAYSMGEYKTVVRGDFQPGTRRLEIDARQTCAHRPAQRNEMIDRWRAVDFAYGSQLAANLIDERAKRMEHEPITAREFVVLRKVNEAKEAAGMLPPREPIYGRPTRDEEDEAAEILQQHADPGSKLFLTNPRAWPARRDFMEVKLHSAVHRWYVLLGVGTTPEFHDEYRAVKAWLAFHDDRISHDQLLAATGGVDVDAIVHSYALSRLVHARPTASSLAAETAMIEQSLEFGAVLEAIVQNLREGVAKFEANAINLTHTSDAVARDVVSRQRLSDLTTEFLARVDKGQLYKNFRPCPDPEPCDRGTVDDAACDLYDPPPPVKPETSPVAELV